MDNNTKGYLNWIGFPVEHLLEEPVFDYHPEKCEKPNCRCVEIAETKNSGRPVKNYPCLAKNNDIENNRKMDNNSWKTIDNTKAIPELMIDNVQAAAEDYSASSQCIKDSYMAGAQYGYNIAQVFVNDLKEDVEKLSARCKQLENVDNNILNEQGEKQLHIDTCFMQLKKHLIELKELVVSGDRKRDISVAITNLETAELWFNKSIDI